MPVKQQSVFKALADPTRRDILKTLQNGSLTAGEIADLFPITRGIAVASFQRAEGGRAGADGKGGRHIVYSLNATVAQEAAALLLDIFSPRTKPRESGRGRGRQSKRHSG